MAPPARRHLLGGPKREKPKGEDGRLQAKGGIKKNAKKALKPVSLKNQIRSCERLLHKDDLPPAARKATEARLEQLKKEHAAHARSELERKMAIRYHRVKFFERRKLERRIKQVQKQLALGPASDDDTAKLQQELESLLADLQYLQHFPKTEKYVSLFVGADDPIVQARRQELRQIIKDNLAREAAEGKAADPDIEDVAEAIEDVDDFFMGTGDEEPSADDDMPTTSAPRSSKKNGVLSSPTNHDRKAQKLPRERYKAGTRTDLFQNHKLKSSKPNHDSKGQKLQRGKDETVLRTAKLQYHKLTSSIPNSPVRAAPQALPRGKHEAVVRESKLQSQTLQTSKPDAPVQPSPEAGIRKPVETARPRALQNGTGAGKLSDSLPQEHKRKRKHHKKKAR
eukprot:jgi/Chlat1/3069/Chrsp21S03320